MSNRIAIADIYKDVCALLKMELDDSHRRLLNKRVTFLLEQVAFVSKSELMQNGQKKMFVPEADAAIIRNILYTCETEDGDLIVKWINGSLDISEPWTSIALNAQLAVPIRSAEMSFETDEVTVDEWISAIQCLTGFDYARQAVALEKQLRKLRECSLGARRGVDFGAVYCDDGCGHRNYVLEAGIPDKPLSDAVLDEIVAKLGTANDFFVAINQITEKMIEKMESGIVEDLRTFAMAKGAFEAEKVYSRDEDSASIVSDYVPYYNHLADYCKSHPDITEMLEKEQKITGLEDFLRCVD